MRTEAATRRTCRLASAGFFACLLGAGLGAGALAADNAPAVLPPRPVVVQPTAAMAPPPPIVAETAPQSAGKNTKAAKSVKPPKPGKKQKPVKPARKSRSAATPTR